MLLRVRSRYKTKMSAVTVVVSHKIFEKMHGVADFAQQSNVLNYLMINTGL